jgi:hypothetical protein
MVSAVNDFTLYLPSYNDSQQVIHSLESSPDWNVVISDNCSDEPHASTLAALASDRVQVIRQPRQLGRVGNWRFCLEHFVASGATWYKTLAAGDRHLPGALLSFRRAAVELAEPRLLIGQVEVVHPHTSSLWKGPDAVERARPEAALRSAARRGNIFFGGCAHAIHREALANGIYLGEGALSYCADFYLAAAAARCGNSYWLPVPVGQMIVALRRTFAVKENTLEAVLEEALVRYRIAQWLRQITGNDEEQRRINGEIAAWLTAQLPGGQA